MMRVNPLIVCREEFDGSGCLFNPDDGKVFGVNATGLAIWRIIENGECADTAAVLEQLAARCDAPLPPGAADEVEAFVGELRTKGYISLD